MREIRRLFYAALAFVFSALWVSGAAYAAGPDLSTITEKIDFGTVATAVIGLFAAMIPVGLALKGGAALAKKLGFG